MINLYRKLPIAHKLRILLMLIGLAVIISFSSIYTYYGIYSIQKNLQTETTNAINLLGSRNVAAIRFNNSKFATNNLKSFAAVGSYVRVCLYNSSAEVFAAYPDVEGSCPVIKAIQNGMFGESITRGENSFSIMRNIVSDGELVGAIWAERSLSTVSDYIHSQINTIIGVALISLLINYFIADYLQRTISRPIMEIAKNAQTIAVEHALEKRLARQYGDDELGKVAEAFNRILNKMEDKIQELSNQNSNLIISHRLTLKRLEALTEKFSDSTEAFCILKILSKKQDLGPAKKDYLDYQNDISESLALNTNNLDALIKFSYLYADALATPRETIDLREYVNEFTKKLKNTVPFLGIDWSGQRKERPIAISVHSKAWDEMFAILFRLYVSLAGFVEFRPALKAELSTEASAIYLTFGDFQVLTRKEPVANLLDKFGDLEVGFNEMPYRKNSIEDPDVAEDFLNEEFLLRSDFQDILDSVTHIAYANEVITTYHFESGKFVVCFELSKVLKQGQEAVKRLTTA